MMYTHCKYADGTEMVSSDIRKNENGEDTIRVIFERPMEYGFDTVIFELPSYRIIRKDGKYTDKEIEMFKKTVECGAHIFYKVAQKGGLNIA